MHQTYCMNNSFHTLLDKVSIGWQRGVVSRLQHAAAGQRTAVEACRRHSCGTHMKKVAVVVMGNTKGTAWQIFQIGCWNREPLSEEIISNFSSSLWFGLAGKNVWKSSDLPSLAPITLQGFNQYQCYN